MLQWFSGVSCPGISVVALGRPAVLLRQAAQANGSSAEAFRVGKKHLQSEWGSYSGLAVSALLLGLWALEKAPCPISRFS